MINWSQIIRFLFGPPLRTEHAEHERLPKFLALPVFASDALSSTAYATEEILRVLILAVPVAVLWSQTDLSALKYLMPAAIAIAILLIIVVTSYVQTILAYPTGGGSYIVASENLGSLYGRIAGGALLIDYTLTVAVSISAGVAAIASFVPIVLDYTVPVALIFVALVTIANLRGVRESGALFALPTYSFIASMFLVIGTCIWKFIIMGQEPHQAHTLPPNEILNHTLEPITLILLIRAFSNGCTALSGVEAISDGVAAFKKPESRNAAITLIMMAVILIAMFLGVSYFAFYLQILPIPETNKAYQTVVSQIARSALGDGGLYQFVQIATMAILVLAANTAFADFPRLAYFMARDGFMPRQLMNQGDRLVFQNGIVILALVACALILWSHADTHKLIPLYATGVFVSFTMSQAGMVSRHIRVKQKGWVIRALISAIGTLVTAIVAVIIFTSKFHEGAYIVGIFFAILLFTFWFIHNHYVKHKQQLSVTDLPTEITKVPNTVLLLVPRVNKGIIHALQYSKSIGFDCRAVHVNINAKSAPQVRSEWEKYGGGVPLVILESPYRSITEPIIEYVEETIKENANQMVTVIVPEFVPRKFWHRLLHNNIALQLGYQLGRRKNVIITNVRYFLEE